MAKTQKSPVLEIHTCVRFKETGAQEHIDGTPDKLVAYLKERGKADGWSLDESAYKTEKVDVRGKLAVYIYYFQDLDTAQLKKAINSKLAHYQWQMEEHAIQIDADELPDLYYEIEAFIGGFFPEKTA